MYNPNIHHRHTIRLKGYDYSKAGLYFVTICVQNRQCLFGKIIDGEMVLNDAGIMIEKWCIELSRKFSDIALNTYIIMPNHFHAIVINNGLSIVGADLRVCPDKNLYICPDENNVINSDIKQWQMPTNNGQTHRSAPTENTGSPLCTILQWFKTMTTNEYICGVKTLGWQPFDKKLWQRNYYEHIIRNEQSYQRITQYIINNPAKWNYDKFHTK